MKTTTNKSEGKERRVKLCLLSGETLTHNEALKRFGCSRLASVIHKMRLERIDIHTELVSDNGDSFARYSVIKKKKESRIKTVLLER